MDEANLLRQESIAYALISKRRPSTAFCASLMSMMKQMAPSMNMPVRTHVGMLSEVTFSSLKLPPQKKDKALSKRLWKAQWQLANQLHSQTYIHEARLAWQIMEALWSDDAEIHDFRDLIEQ